MVMAGFLPFRAIYIELFCIFGSLWGHRIYTIYSIIFIVFIILLIVTVIINIALAYFQLASEDHEWWWRSFLCRGSTGLYVYAYCLYYYYALSDMSGFMQTSFFFGYMACICYGFFLMLGMVGFCTALSHLPIHQVCVAYQYQIKFEECYCKNQLVKSGSSLRQGVMAA